MQVSNFNHFVFTKRALDALFLKNEQISIIFIGMESQDNNQKLEQAVIELNKYFLRGDFPFFVCIDDVKAQIE